MLNALAREIHENAVNHGWYDEPRTFGEIIALCHSEYKFVLSRKTPECRGLHLEV